MSDDFRGHERAILAALGINWYGAKKVSGHIHCPFPNHEDKHPSWRFDDGERFGWICTCGFGDLMDAVQRMGYASGTAECRKWIEDRIAVKSLHQPKPQPQKPQLAAVADGYQIATQRPTPSEIRHPRHGIPVHVAVYQNADGSIAEVRARYEHEDGKEVCPWSLYGDRWTMRQMPGPRPLYRLPALLKEQNKPVLFVEGESAKAARAHALFPDHVVTSASGGALAAAGMDYTPLKGRRIVVWPDNDAPGRTYAETVCRLAMAAGAVEARIVDVPEDWPRAWDLGDEPPSDSVDLRDMLDCANAWKPRPEPQPKAAPDMAEREDVVIPFSTLSAAAVPAPRPETRQDEKQQKFKLTRFRDIKPVLSGQWLIKGLLPARGLCTVFGEPGCGKSFLALDMALHVAGGREYAGRKTKQARVIYIAAEGQGGFRNRVIEAAKALDLDENTQFDLIEVAPNLGVKNGDAAELIQAIEEQSEATDLPVGIVVVDTTSQTMGGENENLEGMATFIVNANAIAAHFQCLSIAIHHVGKGDTQTPRGWSGLHGANDAEIKVTGLSNPHGAEVVKQKDGETGVSFQFNLTRVEVGRDEDDEPVTTCVLEKLGEPVKPEQDRRDLAKTSRRSVREFDAAFNDAIHAHAEDYHIDGDGPLVRAVFVHHVRPYFAKRWATDEEDKKKRADRTRAAFKSVLKSLPPRYHTRTDASGEWIWRTS